MKKIASEFDVIVVGGGGSGLAAAVSAAEQGCSVLLLEKQASLGGTTGIAVGSFTSSGTRLQAKAKIEDSAEEHSEDAAKFAPEEIEALNQRALRDYFLSHTSETLEWLEAMGLAFHGPNPEPPNRKPRMHNVVPNAKAYVAVLQSRLVKLGGEIRCSAAVVGLMRDEDRISGVKVDIAGEEKSIEARLGVVLAAGDYANAPDLIAAYKGDSFSEIEGINPHAKGDGHRLVDAIGGKLLNMEVTYGPELRFIPQSMSPFDQLIPVGGLKGRLMAKLLPLIPKFIIRKKVKKLLVTWQHPENALFEAGAILLNREGKRFCHEVNLPEREVALSRQKQKEAYILLDDHLMKQFSEWPHFISTAPEIAYAYVNDYERLRPDLVKKAKSLTSLALQAGMVPKNLHDSVKGFNLYVAGEQDDPFGRQGDATFLGGEKWMLLGPVKSWFTTTEGGAAISESGQVLDTNDTPIPGLYAVGQNGLGGQILWGHGLHIAWALTSGRLVGLELGSRKTQ